MVTRQEMLELVQAHATLDDPLEAAIWIWQGDREAWLVEVVPSMPPDEHPERPVTFNPGLSFRHPLNLVVGNQESIEQALRSDNDLARAVAEGAVLHGDDLGERLKRFASELSNGHIQAG